MISPLLARYGNRDNQHDLLEWQGSPGQLPPELLILTERPGGRVPLPGECWWPAVGCGPVGAWWALWWTLPDDTARRGGMVCSKVALWRLEDIGTVDDLRPAMQTLSGEETIAPAPASLMQAVAEALVPRGDKELPPAVPDLAAWPGIIADLWQRLWPEARRAFAARVALSPPSGGESVAPPCLYAVPPGQQLEWSVGNRKIVSAQGASKPSRAVAWLMGGADPAMSEVLTACGPGFAKLGILSTAARTAGCLDALRNSPSAETALDLLGPLAGGKLAPSAEAAAGLKQEALRALAQGFPEASPRLVLSLTNLGPALPAESLPKQALTAWASRQIPVLPPAESAEFLERLAPESTAQTWWKASVREALAEGLADPNADWAKTALAWLGLPGCPAALAEILPATEAVESRLLAAACRAEPSRTALPSLRSQTAGRGWSRLHAWAAMQEFPAPEVFRAQSKFPGNPLPGLAYLAEQLPGTAVVEAAVSALDPRLIPLAAGRTAKDPGLLRPLDAAHPAWRGLWAAHVAAGGERWPVGVNRDVAAQGLLDAVLAGDEPPGLVTALAGDLAAAALRHPGRNELWAKLGADGRGALLPRTAEALIRACEGGQDISAPESPLLSELIQQVRTKRPSAKLIAALLSWDASLSQQEVIQWLRDSDRIGWDRNSASLVGKVVLNKGWKDAALEIYGGFRRFYGYIPAFQYALEVCYELLPWWERWILSSHGIVKAAATPEEHKSIVTVVADLGADIAPDGLEDIWERAGGRRKDLKDGSNPSTRWREAASLAHKGGLNGGVLPLVEELLKIVPSNPKLIELQAALTCNKPFTYRY